MCKHVPLYVRQSGICTWYVSRITCAVNTNTFQGEGARGGRRGRAVGAGEGSGVLCRVCLGLSPVHASRGHLSACRVLGVR